MYGGKKITTLCNRNQGSVANYTSKLSAITLIEKEIKFVVIRGGGHAGRRNWVKAVKRYKLPVTREINTRAVMYNMVAIINMAVW